MYIYVYVMYICILNNQFANNSLPKTFDYAYVRLIHLVIKYVLYATNNITDIGDQHYNICMHAYVYAYISIYRCVLLSVCVCVDTET